MHSSEPRIEQCDFLSLPHGGVFDGATGTTVDIIAERNAVIPVAASRSSTAVARAAASRGGKLVARPKRERAALSLGASSPSGAPLRLGQLAASVMAAAEGHYFMGLPAPPMVSRTLCKMRAPTSEWVCLLVPTSLCSSEVARSVAADLGEVHHVVGVEHRRLLDVLLVAEYARAHRDGRDHRVHAASSGASPSRSKMTDRHLDERASESFRRA